MEFQVCVEVIQVRAETHYEGTIIVGEKKHSFAFQVLIPLALIDPENIRELFHATKVQIKRGDGGCVELNVRQQSILAQLLIRHVKAFSGLLRTKLVNTLASQTDYFQTPSMLPISPTRMQCAFTDEDSERVIREVLEALP